MRKGRPTERAGETSHAYARCRVIGVSRSYGMLTLRASSANTGTVSASLAITSATIGCASRSSPRSPPSSASFPTSRIRTAGGGRHRRRRAARLDHRRRRERQQSARDGPAMGARSPRSMPQAQHRVLHEADDGSTSDPSRPVRAAIPQLGQSGGEARMTEPADRNG